MFGQTGTGKTFTIKGLLSIAMDRLLEPGPVELMVRAGCSRVG